MVRISFLTFKTCIEPVDYALPKGFPKRAAVALTGAPGTGKSVIAANIAWNVLRKGGKVTYLNMDDSPDALIELFQNFGWDVDKYVSNGSFKIVDCFSFRLGRLKREFKGVSRTMRLDDLNALLYVLNEEVPPADGNVVSLVVVDSINELMFRFEMIQVLEFIKSLRATVCKGLGATALMILHTSTDVLRELAAHLEYLVDGMIYTRIEPNLMELGIPLKQLLVKKMRGLPTNPLWISYAIVDDGVHAVDPAKLATLVQSRLREAEKLKAMLSKSGQGK